MVRQAVSSAMGRVGEVHEVVEVSGVSSWAERNTSAGEAEREAEDVRLPRSEKNVN